MNDIDGIDIHAHAVPPSFLKEVQRSGLANVEAEVQGDRYFVTFPGKSRLRPIAGNMIDFDRRLAWMDSQAMRHQIIAPWLDVHGQELPPRDGQSWVSSLNDAMSAAIEGSHGRLHAYATLHLADAAAAAAELERAVRDLKMVGCMLPTHLPEGGLHDTRLDALWEVAQALDVPVVLHGPTESPSAEYFRGAPELRGLYGRTLDSSFAATLLITKGALDRFPGLRLVLVHGGGFIPYQTGRMDALLTPPGERPPSSYVKSFYYDTVLMSSHSLRLLIDLVGADRLMIGSDYAANPSERAAPPLLAALDEMRLDDRTRSLVVHGTAEQRFRLPVSA